MDYNLRCNHLKCRVQLNDRAVVTTCSHIFCTPCSETLGLAEAVGDQRKCPACNARLPNPDDVAATCLNPTEDYKTSVLSGLNPTIIAECSSRALAFWSYQTTQEVIYQEHVAKTLTERYNSLSLQVDKLVNDANAEIDGLNQRISQLTTDQEKLKQDNQTLLNALRDKNRKHAQTQEAYDRLRRREMTQITQNAAANTVQETLNAPAAGPSMSGARNAQPRGHPVNAFPTYPNRVSNPRLQAIADRNAGFHIRGDDGEMHRAGVMEQRYSPNLPQATPANGHRTRLSHNSTHSNGLNVPTHNGNNFPSAGQASSSRLHRGSHVSGHVNGPIINHNSNIGLTPSGRRPLGAMSANAYTGVQGNGNGYGLSAHMRAGSVLGHVAGDEINGPLWVAG